MKIIRAEEKEFQKVRDFYYEVIDAVGDAGDSVGWKKDIYPSPEFLMDSIRKGELFLAEEDGKLIGAMVVNHAFNEEYRSVNWPTEAEDSEITVIHALAVLPSCRKKGVAKQMVREVIQMAGENGQKVIRLDVLRGNKNAEKLYAGLGFQYLHTLPMYYEDTGRTEFELYEYPL